MPKDQTRPDTSQTTIPFSASDGERLDIATLETWLWDAACVIRGAMEAPKFKDFILPLIFYKRLSDVFDDEFAEQIEEWGSEEKARKIIEDDHKNALTINALNIEDTPIVRFYIPQKYCWAALRNHPADGRLGEFLTEAMREVARLNPQLQGVVDVKDFNERQSEQRILKDERLEALIERISRHRLGLQNTEPDILGRAYEYLLRKFAEGQGQSAGEFYTPKEVGWLMARLIDPEPYTTIHDPACGSGGLLIKPRLLFEQTHPGKESSAPKICGQEWTPTTYAMAKMNAFLHDFIGADLRIGDTFRNPRFVTNDSTLERFDYVLANPMWNQKEYNDTFYANDSWQRFTYGVAPNFSADWAWVQHILASLKATGRATIVLDTGAVSRGSGTKSSNRERDIRKQFVENDLIEGVIRLPENLFYNTQAPGIILLLNRDKPPERKSKILLINLSNYFVKQKPKNVLTDEGIDVATAVYQAWESRERLSRVITLEDARNADYNLSPAQFVDVGDPVEHRPIHEIMTALSEARIAREQADKALAGISPDWSEPGGSVRNQENLPEHWKILSFENCLKTVKSKKVSSIPKTDYQESGEFPVIDQGATFIAGWTDSTESVVFDNLPVVVFGDHTRIFKYVDFPFAVGADGTKLLYPNDDVLDARFFYYALLNLKVPNKGYNRHYRYLRELAVVCPSRPEQRAIAHILRTIQEAKSTRHRETELERERKAALMDRLFSHGMKGEPRKQTEIGEIPESWEIQPFDECLKKVKSKKISSIPQTDYQESGEFPVIDQGASFISGWTDLTEFVIFDNLPVVIFGDHTRIFKYVDFPFAVGADGTKLLYPNDDVLDARFFYYALLNLKVPNKGYNRHYRYLRELAVVCPPLPEQRVIAEILQACDTKIAALEKETTLLDELFHAMLDELMTGKRSVVPRIDSELPD